MLRNAMECWTCGTEHPLGFNCPTCTRNKLLEKQNQAIEEQNKLIQKQNNIAEQTSRFGAIPVEPVKENPFKEIVKQLTEVQEQLTVNLLTAKIKKLEPKDQVEVIKYLSELINKELDSN